MAGVYGMRGCGFESCKRQHFRKINFQVDICLFTLFLFELPSEKVLTIVNYLVSRCSQYVLRSV